LYWRTPDHKENMSNTQRNDECRLAFRGLPEDAVHAITINWLDWCTRLGKTLLAGDGRSFAPEAQIVSGNEALPGQPVAAPELEFLALPYAVQVGARRPARLPVEANKAIFAGATA
jgi:hypothetical protein